MTLTPDFNSSVSVPFQRMRMLLQEQGGGIQEGVVGATDLKVVQRGAGANMSVDVGAGAAWVQIDTGTRNGLGHVYNDATANVTVTASNGTNPRIDQIILRWNDTSIPTGAGNVPTLEVLTGTATSGATLDNRTGATALPNDCLRLADILVPTSSTSVVTANIRDRRPWARGAYNRVARTQNAVAGSNYTTSLAVANIDPTNLAPRIECSGVPLRIRASMVASHSVASALVLITFAMDGTIVDSGAAPFGQSRLDTSAVTNVTVERGWTTIPVAGSHVVSLQAGVVTAGTLTLGAAATTPLLLEVEEIVRPSASNT